mmetsp:Transcript_26341/g.73967  ORF Transcript_26341/g.73967 Transcript_26341/m.73967 type:complete len:192 (+) Transcript_26341:104-679(+)
MPEVGAKCAQRVRCCNGLFTFLGAVVGLLLTAQGVLVFVGVALGHDDAPDDFWQGCRWVAHGSLCVGLGLTCCALEIKSCLPGVKRHVGWFFANRIGLALMYLWVGCYAAGGALRNGPDWAVYLGHATGVLAWVVSLSHLVLAGCAERPPDAPSPEAKPAADPAESNDVEAQEGKDEVARSPIREEAQAMA